jgi:type IV pilus assembly protein PilQ
LQKGGKERLTEGGRNQQPELRHQKPSYGEGKISLTSKDADIRLVLQKIAEAAGQNLIVSDAVQGKISLRLIDVPWQEALEIILRTNNLAIIREGNVVRIVTQEEYNQKNK